MNTERNSSRSFVFSVAMNETVKDEKRIQGYKLSRRQTQSAIEML